MCSSLTWKRQSAGPTRISALFPFLSNLQPPLPHSHLLSYFKLKKQKLPARKRWFSTLPKPQTSFFFPLSQGRNTATHLFEGQSRGHSRPQPQASLVDPAPFFSPLPLNSQFLPLYRVFPSAAKECPPPDHPSSPQHTLSVLLTAEPLGRVDAGLHAAFTSSPRIHPQLLPPGEVQPPPSSGRSCAAVIKAIGMTNSLLCFVFILPEIAELHV